MQKEKMQEYTRRISQSNRTQLVVVMFDMIQTYLEDAKVCYDEKNREGFKQEVRRADKVIQELQDVLDFKYDLSKELYVLYRYCRERLAVSMMRFELEGLKEAQSIMSRIGSSFRLLAEKDQSEPLMKNTETVYAGMTYGKFKLVENYTGNESNRGFLV